MRLSEAIILGDTLKKCDPAEWISKDGSCGCAFGGALLAAGVTAEEFHEQIIKTKPFSGVWFTEMPCVMSRWSWLTADHVDEISRLYWHVAEGTKTIEDVASYVRSVEPAEQSPTNVLDAREAVTVA